MIWATCWRRDGGFRRVRRRRRRGAGCRRGRRRSRRTDRMWSQRSLASAAGFRSRALVIANWRTAGQLPDSGSARRVAARRQDVAAGRRGRAGNERRSGQCWSHWCGAMRSSASDGPQEPARCEPERDGYLYPNDRTHLRKPRRTGFWRLTGFGPAQRQAARCTLPRPSGGDVDRSMMLRRGIC